jgi:hypothetical protein
MSAIAGAAKRGEDFALYGAHLTGKLLPMMRARRNRPSN